MANRNRKGGKKPYMGSPWAHGSFDPSGGFYPNNFMAPAMGMMNPYMQNAFGNYGGGGGGGGGGGPMFGRNFNNRKDFGGNFRNQRMQYNDYQGPNRRFSPKGMRGHNAGMGGRNKRFMNDGGNRGNAKKQRTSEPYNPAEPTGEEEDNGQRDSESDQDQSSKFGANAPSQDWRKKNRRSHYCTVCETDFAGSFLIHRRTKEHRKHRDKKFPRCRLCRKTFQGMKEFEEHGKTEEHKKKSEDFQALKEQQLIHASLSEPEDDEVSLQRYISSQGEETITDENAEPVGQFHVVPLKVFLCKLCQKFFSNYTDGRQIHCRTADHIQNYKVYFDGKEARAAERNRLKQAEKKAQQDKKDEEKEKGEGENEEGDEEQEENEAAEGEGEEAGEDEQGAEEQEEQDGNEEGEGEDQEQEEDAAEGNEQGEDEDWAEENGVGDGENDTTEG